ncbi:hypothetical protein N7448_009895 [Penicillium atrosanguineum]|uniref:uncharacterized protein n=1 Tax=Penicillium atrosanguineum TaxID=1132637 RepID=UPI00238ACFB1|nr:uncharacterized protein N7443_007113 [Penicillium atrosanguineum]KAJ5119226.1 hypothetical protein N7448_009895 [Penicillium atrosanguineum]KAJ5296220.1 hypothetical protein N7443_007113 [Penicillium atrosanguineum]
MPPMVDAMDPQTVEDATSPPSERVRDFTRKVIVLYLMEQSDEFRELSLLRDGITPKAMVISEHNVEMPIKVA